VAVDWTWVPLQLRKSLKVWHPLGLCSSPSSSAAQIPFLALLLSSSKLPDLLHLLDPGSHGASPGPGRSLVLACFGLAQCVGGEPLPTAPDGGDTGHQRGVGLQGRLRYP